MMFRSFTNKLLGAMQFVAGLALASMMLVTVADVALRFLFNTPVRGTYDLVSVALLVMVMFGIAPVILQGADIVIDLFDRVLPAGVLRVLQSISALGAFCAFLFIGWSMWGPARDAWLYGDRSLELGLPLWSYWAVAFVGLFGILWAALALLAARIKNKPESGEQI